MSEHNIKTINMYNSGGALEYIGHNDIDPETEKWERLFNYVEKELIVENTGYSRNQIFTFEKYINLF